jgi:uncharacterized protein
MMIRVKVKPNARASSLERNEDGSWTARLKSPPTDGKANYELVAMLAEHFSCRKALVSIRTGVSARVKLVEIDL